MNVDFNFRANNKFVVSCQKHGEVDRAASKVAAVILADNHSKDATGPCGSAHGCKYDVEDSTEKK